ncbi:MAG: M48 family metalloprotease [Candidatus Omnitrophota bacterium]
MRTVLVLFLTLMIGLGLGACVSTEVSYEPENAFGQAEDELGLWRRSDSEERVLLRSGFIADDPPLTEYINTVLHKVTGEFEKRHQVSLRAYVIRDPYFNAFMLPNGAMFIHTGLIANLENEAQLATVLGHEAAHFFKRHRLKKHRSRIHKSAFFSMFQTAFGPGNYTRLARLYRNLVVNGSMAGYSRELEREADRIGFELMRKAGYDPYESRRAFERLADATKGKKKLPYFFNSHPRAKERIRNFSKLLALMEREQSPFKTAKGEEEFKKMAAAVFLDNARLSLRCNKLKDAIRQAKQLVRDNDLRDQEKVAEARLIMARAYARQKKNEEALEVLSIAIEEYPFFAAAYREMGLMMYKKADTDSRREARVCFEKYLRLNPEASDAEYVRGYLHEG